ncbi:MAG TPA: hypothetical protein VFL29_04050 [Candidatus Dormibacteraeota bacterium]|nr:hypothetical protein [Candidatus Dormibacteraeota bacterium]
MSNLSDAQRGWFRERGRGLARDLLAYLDANQDQAPAFIVRAESDAREYGAEAAKAGASLSDTVEDFLRFRKPFIDELASLARRRGLDTGEATGLLVEAQSALDRLLVALMTGHGGPASGD